MHLLPLAIQADPVTFSAFTPLMVAVALWVAFVDGAFGASASTPRA